MGGMSSQFAEAPQETLSPAPLHTLVSPGLQFSKLSLKINACAAALLLKANCKSAAKRQILSTLLILTSYILSASLRMKLLVFNTTK